MVKEFCYFSFEQSYQKVIKIVLLRNCHTSFANFKFYGENLGVAPKFLTISRLFSLRILAREFGCWTKTSFTSYCCRSFWLEVFIFATKKLTEKNLIDFGKIVELWSEKTNFASAVKTEGRSITSAGEVVIEKPQSTVVATVRIAELIVTGENSISAVNKQKGGQ